MNTDDDQANTNQKKTASSLDEAQFHDTFEAVLASLNRGWYSP